MAQNKLVAPEEHLVADAHVYRLIHECDADCYPSQSHQHHCQDEQGSRNDKVVIIETYLGAIKQSAVGIIEEANTSDDEDRNVLISHFVDGIRR